MRRRTRVAGIVAALTATATTMACGSESVDRVPAGAWAKSVCSAVTPWSAEVQRLQDQVRQKMTARPSVEQAKIELVQLFGGMELATDTALRKAKGAGIPEVPDGPRIATQFVRALVVARDSFGAGMSAVQRLPTADQNAFYAGVVTAGEAMSTQNGAAERAFATVSSPELDKAFNDLPECR